MSDVRGTWGEYAAAFAAEGAAAEDRDSIRRLVELCDLSPGALVVDVATELVERRHLTNVMSLNTSVMTGSRIFGPALAALGDAMATVIAIRAVNLRAAACAVRAAFRRNLFPAT